MLKMTEIVMKIMMADIMISDDGNDDRNINENDDK